MGSEALESRVTGVVSTNRITNRSRGVPAPDEGGVLGRSRWEPCANLWWVDLKEQFLEPSRVPWGLLGTAACKDLVVRPGVPLPGVR